MNAANRAPQAANPVLSEVATRLEAALPGRVERAAPIGPLTTYRVGGRAAVLVRVETADDLAAVASAVSPRRSGAPARGAPARGAPGAPSAPSDRTAGPLDVQVLVIGRGSNVLVADRGFDGVALVLGDGFDQIALPDRDDAGASAAIVEAGASVALPVLSRRCAAAGWAGLEFYVGIPGSVGGAVRMNAGGHGTDTAAVLVDASIADLAHDGRARRRGVAGLALSYRSSALAPSQIVLGARFQVTLDSVAAVTSRVDEIVRWRREHQPGGANAGSVFTNPPGDSAGRLVDVCGGRGLRRGGAHVSTKHANFIQADPGASAADVFELIGAVQRLVEDRTGISLALEIRLIGFEIDQDGCP